MNKILNSRRKFIFDNQLQNIDPRQYVARTTTRRQISELQNALQIVRENTH